MTKSHKKRVRGCTRIRARTISDLGVVKDGTLHN